MNDASKLYGKPSNSAFPKPNKKQHHIKDENNNNKNTRDDNNNCSESQSVT